MVSDSHLSESKDGVAAKSSVEPDASTDSGSAKSHKNSYGKIFKLPPYVDFGMGHKVSVKLADQKSLATIVGCEEGKAPAGLWDSNTRTIYIDETVSLIRRHKIFWHELMHALIDEALDDEGGA